MLYRSPNPNPRGVRKCNKHRKKDRERETRKKREDKQRKSDKKDSYKT